MPTHPSLHPPVTARAPPRDAFARCAHGARGHGPRPAPARHAKSTAPFDTTRASNTACGSLPLMWPPLHGQARASSPGLAGCRRGVTRACARVNITPCCHELPHSLRCAPLGGATLRFASRPSGSRQPPLCLAPLRACRTASWVQLAALEDKSMCGHGFAIAAGIEAWRLRAVITSEAPARPGRSAGAGSCRCASLSPRPVCPSSRPPPVGAPRSVRLAPQGFSQALRAVITRAPSTDRRA
jgi:hypothetical protein